MKQTHILETSDYLGITKINHFVNIKIKWFLKIRRKITRSESIKGWWISELFQHSTKFESNKNVIKSISYSFVIWINNWVFD